MHVKNAYARLLDEDADPLALALALLLPLLRLVPVLAELSPGVAPALVGLDDELDPLDPPVRSPSQLAHPCRL